MRCFSKILQIYLYLLPNSRRTVRGFCIHLGGSLISWKYEKQLIISLSLAEAEYRAMSKVVDELAQLIFTLFALNWLMDSSSLCLIFTLLYNELAYTFTKSLTGLRHRSLTGKSGVRPPSNLRGMLDLNTGLLTVGVSFRQFGLSPTPFLYKT